MAVMLVATAEARAQVRTVSGTVVSSVDGRTVEGAIVRVQGAIAGTRTTGAGTFTLEVPPQTTEILVITHPEHDPLEVDIQGRTTVSVTLQSNIRFNQYGVAVPRKPLEAEARDGLLVFESKDGEYKLWMDLRVQMDGGMFFGETLNPIGNGIEMRRARLAFKSEFAKKWYAELDMDFADSRADLKDAFLQYSPTDRLALKAGNFKEIFSMETNTTSRYLPFMERPMVTRALTPSRHAGFQVVYSRPYLMTAGGLHFQDVGGWEEVQLRKDNNSAFGADEGYSVTGKMVLMPLYHDTEKGLHLGAAASYRTPKTHDRPGAVRIDVRGISNINRKKYLDTDRMLDVDNTVLTGLEAAAYYRGFRIQSEYNTSKVTFKDTARGHENFRGFYVFGTAMLFGGRHQYNTGDGEFTQPKLGRAWGDVELGVRYEYLDLNSREDGIMAGEGEGLTVGLNAYMNNNVKLSVNYGLVNHDRWANGRGRLATGLDAAGVPTTNPRLVVAPKGKGGEDFSSLSFRVQVSF
jgi:phosphate-selective porin OprO/OprP